MNASEPKLECMVCGEKFESLRSLHAHIKVHKMTLMDYYPTFFERKNLLTDDPIPFKNVDQYFSTDFSNVKQMRKWLSIQPKEVAQKYTLDILKSRMARKGYKYAPCHLDLLTAKCPTVREYREFFGSYKEACDKAGLKQRFYKPMPEISDVPKDLKIAVDTREQLPWNFSYKSQELKLDFGDYTLLDEHYNRCFVDRKSENDFKGTFGKGISRFKRELDRAREFDSYIFVVVENTIQQITRNNYGGPNFKKVNFENVLHNVRDVMDQYGDVCQILFVENRAFAEDFVPKLLYHGPNLKNVDVQYFLENK